MTNYRVNYETTSPEKIAICEGCYRECTKFDFAEVKLLCNECMPHGIFEKMKKVVMEKINK